VTHLRSLLGTPQPLKPAYFSLTARELFTNNRRHRGAQTELRFSFVLISMQQAPGKPIRVLSQCDGHNPCFGRALNLPHELGLAIPNVSRRPERSPRDRNCAASCQSPFPNRKDDIN
jgi:hypothetical protein